MSSEIARAGMKHEGIIIQYMNPFYLCVMAVVLLVLLCLFVCVSVCVLIRVGQFKFLRCDEILTAFFKRLFQG